MTLRANLEALADLHGIYLSYQDVNNVTRTASDEALFRTLVCLGAPMTKPADSTDALRIVRMRRLDPVLQPVTVVWDTAGQTEFEVQRPAALAHQPVVVTIELETGETISAVANPVGAAQERTAEGKRSLVQTFAVPRRLPWGYHTLTTEVGGKPHSTRLIVAPTQCFVPDGPPIWGVFAPLYGLYTGQSLGGGSYADLQRVSEWAGNLGASVVATLPLLATFLDTPHEPSPYVPMSRRFLNEFFLDIESLPEFAHSDLARKKFSAAAAELGALRSQPTVDYRRQWNVMRPVLEDLSAWFFRSGRTDQNRAELEQFAAENPLIQQYARFRAVTEKRNEVWHLWPERLKAGKFEALDYDESAELFHLYVQWRTSQQLQAANQALRSKGGLGLYLDIPLGVHSDGFDAWRERGCFLNGMAAGAPPDPLFTGGQNWGFAPLHPVGIRADGYRYFVECIRTQLRYAGVLRLDHVMGLHRVFTVPTGMATSDGVYVKYQHEEFYAAINLESQRAKRLVVGENLGTVPPAVYESLGRHRLFGMRVLQFNIGPYFEREAATVPADYIVSLNTHDMPTFAGFCNGLDIEDRVAMGLLKREDATKEINDRRAAVRFLTQLFERSNRLPNGSDPRLVLAACLRVMAYSPARLMLVQLEDLWQEPRPQNVPGTGHERPNWRRKLAYPFEVIEQMPEVTALLSEINKLRRRL